VSAGPTGADAAGVGPWFLDAADAGKYLGEVGRLWVGWLAGLVALGLSRGGVAIVVGVSFLVVLFVLMNPLQNRVAARFAGDEAAFKTARGQILSTRDRALRELAYGRAPFTEALAKRDLSPALRFLPWGVIIASFAAAAAMALVWFEG
jgi:hypothetical protein